MAHGKAEAVWQNGAERFKPYTLHLICEVVAELVLGSEMVAQSGLI